MRKTNFLKRIYSSIFLIFLISCAEANNVNSSEAQGDTSNLAEIVAIENPLSNSPKDDQEIEIGKIYTDTVKFISVDTDYDYWLFYAEKNKDTIGYIFNEEYNFESGDQLEIQWKMDSIWIAGEGDELDFSKWLVSAKKLKVSN